MNAGYLLLCLFIPVALLSHYLGGPALLTFLASALGIVPMAMLMGWATEELAHRADPRLSGFLNGTLGNAAELMISFFAIRVGLLELVKASITGSILGNLLLVMGASLLVGGLRHGIQRFDRTQAGLNATMLILAVIALGIPSLFSHAIEARSHAAVEYLSLGVAGTMLLVYILSQVFVFRNGEPRHGPAPQTGRAWPLRKTVGGLALSTAVIAWLSEVLVGAVEPVLVSLGWTEFFIGMEGVQLLVVYGILALAFYFLPM